MLNLMPNEVDSRLWILDYRKKSKIQHLSSNIFKVKHSFTLIELLITITIIGILASLTLVSYSGTQQKARDAVRKSDLAQVKRALELAKADCTGNAYYPSDGTAPTTHAGAGGAADDYNTFLRPYMTATALKYISSLPADPSNSGNQTYGYNVGGSTSATACPTSLGAASAQPGYSDFLLAVMLEKTSDGDISKSQTNCGSGTGKPNAANYPAASGWYLVCNN